MTPRLVIVGAGISGLALAWFLKKRYGDTLQLTILEADGRAGGWIRTHHTQGFLFEAGPRSCRTRGAGVDTLELAEALGLQDQVIAASPAAQQRYLYCGGTLQPVPHSLWTFLRSPLMRGVLPALWKEWCTPSGSMQDESIADFVGRRLSPDIAQRLVDPLVSGIYAGDIRRLSFRSCFPEMYRLEQTYGSLVKGMLQGKRPPPRQLSPFVSELSRRPIFSFRNGMETLVQALQKVLSTYLQLGCRAEALRMNPASIAVTTQDGQVLLADRVFLALPAEPAATLLGCSINKMEMAPAATVAAVNMGWNDKVLTHEGFGYLAPSSEQAEVLGMVWDSSAFPQQNRHARQTRLTAMLGGSHSPAIAQAPQEEIVARTRQALSKHLGIDTAPDAVHVTLARRAIPQYEVGHQARLNDLERHLAVASNGRLHLVGSAWHGVAVNDCIAHAKHMVNTLI